MDLEVVAASAFLTVYRLLSKNNKKKTRNVWQRKLFCLRNDNLLLTEMDSLHLQNFTRMTSEDFEKLITLVGPKIMKQDTKFRKAIPVKDRLALTLRFLASGDSYTSLQYLFKVSKQRISVIIPETCDALTLALKELIKVSEKFNNIENETLFK